MQMMPHRKNSQGDVLKLLQSEFVERCRKNPRYSLRAYAKALGIEASPLSAILRGKRPLTKKTSQKLGLALGLRLDEVESIQANRKSRVAKFQQITLDHYALISDWYHYAILELTKTKSFKPNVAQVAKTLGITPTETHIAVERLCRLGLLEIKPSGRWVDATTNGFATNIEGELTSHASKKLQKQVLEMSLQALEALPTSVRNHTSITMAIHPDDLPIAKEKIKKFRRELCAFFERRKDPEQVYQLAISLYPLTKQE